MNIEFREAVQEDLNSVELLLPEALNKLPKTIFVATESNKICGVGFLQASPHIPNESSLGIRIEAPTELVRKGLIDHISAVAATWNTEFVELLPQTPAEGPIATLRQQFGFTAQETRHLWELPIPLRQAESTINPTPHRVLPVTGIDAESILEAFFTNQTDRIYVKKIRELLAEPNSIAISRVLVTEDKADTPTSGLIAALIIEPLGTFGKPHFVAQSQGPETPDILHALLLDASDDLMAANINALRFAIPADQDANGLVQLAQEQGCHPTRSLARWLRATE